MGENMIKSEDLVFKYVNAEEQTEKVAINHVSMEVKKGEFLVILGHNGSGKSTMAKHMNALLLPSGGKMYVDGLDTSDIENLWELEEELEWFFKSR